MTDFDELDTSTLQENALDVTRPTPSSAQASRPSEDRTNGPDYYYADNETEKSKFKDYFDSKNRKLKSNSSVIKNEAANVYERKADVIPTSTDESLRFSDVWLKPTIKWPINANEDTTYPNEFSFKANETLTKASPNVTEKIAKCVVNCEDNDVSKKKETSMLLNGWVVFCSIFLSVVSVALLIWVVVLCRKRRTSNNIPVTSSGSAATFSGYTETTIY